jgi:excisionase family DNA binding protein
MTEQPDNTAVMDDGMSSMVDTAAVMDDGGVTVEQAAKRLGVSERTIHRRIKDSKLKAHKVTSPRGDVWCVHLDGAAVMDDSIVSTTIDTGSVAPDLMKALEIIETIRREHEETRRELEAKADQLHQEASEKAEKIAELTGAAAHWQTRAILAEEQARKAEDQVKLLMAPKDEPIEELKQPAEPKRSWWQRLIGGR